MFTGIIEEYAELKKIEKTATGLRFTIGAEVVRDDLKTGHSIAVNGVCLTVIHCENNSFSLEGLNTGETSSPISFTISFESSIELGDLEIYLLINTTNQFNDSYAYNLSFSIPITINQLGFPINLSTEIRGTPIIVDYDLDGDNEVFVGDYLGVIHKYSFPV